MDSPSTTTAATTNTINNNDATLQELTPGWVKFTQLREILNARLAAIMDKYTAKEWVFTGEELRTLVKALFTNSDRRAQFLAMIV